MYRTTTDSLNAASELLGEKKFKEAIKALGEIDVNSISPTEKAFHNLTYVEACLYLSNYEVEDKLNEALDFYRSSDDIARFALAKYLQGWMLSDQGRHFDAREILIEAHLIYKRNDLDKLRARVLNKLGFLCFELGDMQSAEKYVEKSIELYRANDDQVNEFIVAANLGTVYFYTGQLNKAISKYSQIIPQISTWDGKNAARYYIQYSIPLASWGDIDLAKSVLEKAYPNLNDFDHDRAIYFRFLGWIYLIEGRFAEARDCFLDAMNILRESMRDKVLISSIKRQLGEALIGLKEYHKARIYTDEAMVLAEDCKEQVGIAGCYRNLGELHALTGNSEKGREKFRKAIDLFSLINARYELALTRYKAAMSGAYKDGERQALLYMACEYFKKENIEKYVHIVEREMTGFPVKTPPPAIRKKGMVPQIVTVDDTMKQLVSMAENVAESDMSVLLTGATGTGKDLFARYIHNYSRRAGKFVSVNAAAIPDSMIESELFGHSKGAFTNADRDKVGLIEVAHNGTLYLNEIADASKELQAKLLDVLENHNIRRLGETKERRVSFRLIAATNHDLNQLIEAGKFRIDLYHRLGEVPMVLPQLNEREGDIQVMFLHFLALAGVTVDEDSPEFTRLIKLLNRRNWPGNVRQLEAEAKRMALLSKGSLKRMIELSSRNTLNERDQLFDLLRQHDWNRREVARKLNVSDTTIRRKIKKFRLNEN